MKGTVVEGTIPRLLEGEMVVCMNDPFLIFSDEEIQSFKFLFIKSVCNIYLFSL